jgi:predicted dehydrogenase
MNKSTNQNRRQFIKKSTATLAGAVAAPYIIPGSILGKNGAVSPSNKITMGSIGVGGMGTGNLRGFLGKQDAHVVAVCDVDETHKNRARNLVNEKYGNKDCATYLDMEDILERKDIDAVCIALPDQWHAIAGVHACRAGKDIYAEKPLAYTIAEGRAIVNAVEEFGTVWQTGSQQRSSHQFHFACELVRNGYIGQIEKVHVALPNGNSIRAGSTKPCPPPKGFDYDRWLGPAPFAPYSPARCHWNFRWNSDYSQGQVTDWAGHHIDIAQWGLDKDMMTPIEIEGEAVFPPATDGIFDTPESYKFEGTYSDGMKILVTDHKRHPKQTNGLTFYGSEGEIWVNRGEIETTPKGLQFQKIGSNEIRLYKSNDHRQNFLDCVKTRLEPIAPARIAHRSIMVAHLGVISWKLGRKINFDPKTETFPNDAEANSKLTRPMRAPYFI